MNFARHPSRPAPVSELQSHAGFWLRYVSNHVTASFRRALADEGVSLSDWVALRELYDRKYASPGILAECLGMTKGAISKIVARLELRNLVKRAVAPGDRRSQNVSLTTLGRVLVPTLAALADENDQSFFGHLSAHERLELMVTLRGIVRRRKLKTIPVD
jgi:DNA-binding MarR family transcriptional regulator